MNRFAVVGLVALLSSCSRENNSEANQTTTEVIQTKIGSIVDMYTNLYHQHNYFGGARVEFLPDDCFVDNKVMSDNIIELTDKNFQQEVLESKIPVLVDYWASWCGPCQRLAPVLEELSCDYRERLKFAKLSVEDYDSIGTEYNIKFLPTLIIYNKGKEVNRIVGSYPKNILTKMIDSALEKL